MPSSSKRHYVEIIYCLWDVGAEEAHKEYPEISVKELQTANNYCDALRCPGCACGSCVNIGTLASNLDQSPDELKPIANLALKLSQKE